MRVHIFVTGHYEWIPVPADVTVTKHDIDAGRVRPAANGGGYLMRVERKVDASAGVHTEAQIAENQIIARIIHAYTDKGKQKLILTRHEAVAGVLEDLVVPHHTNRRWMHRIEVHDDGPDEALFRAMIAPHLEADHGRASGKNIDAEDVDELVAAYLHPKDANGHVEHLTGHFKIKKGGA